MCSAIAAQQDATEGVFHGRGIVKAIEPATGAVTLAQDGIEGFSPARETTYLVQAPDVSEGLRPGETVEFTIDTSDYVVLRVNILNYDQ
jgi:hypothetical protein